MSENSYLTIGELVFTWRYQIPTFVTFLFKEEDIRIGAKTRYRLPGRRPVEIDPDETA